MNLTAFALRHTRFTYVVVFCAIALGLNSFLTIPRREDPALKVPMSIAVVIFPGASAAEVERLVARPLEDAVKELDGIDKLRSSIKDGLLILTLEFNWDTDPDQNHDALLRQINRVRPSLPSGIARIDVTRVSTTNVAVLQLAVVAPAADPAQLEQVIADLRRHCEAVPGVRATERYAMPTRQVRVTLDPDRVASLGLPLAQIAGAIQAGNTNLPGGAIELDDRRFNMETSGAFRSLDEIRRTPVAGSGTAVVRLGDIAEVAWATEPMEYFGRLNGERAVFVTVMPTGNADLFAVRDGVAAALARFRTTLPAGWRVEAVFDQTENIDRRLSRLEEDFGLALLLVLLTVLPLGFRASVLVMLSIPLSLALGVAGLQVMGHSLNQLSIVGFVIALGLLVDDSIVVVENIARFRRMGYAPLAAAEAATKQIAVAVVGTTAALIFAFLPLLHLPGGAGQFVKPLPLAVVFTVLASMVVSLTIVPLLAARLLRGNEPEHGNALLQLLDRGIRSSYRPILHCCMQHRWLTLAAAAGLTAFTPVLVNHIGFSLFPKAGIPQFLVEIEAEEGSSLAATDAITRQVEAILAASPDVAWTMANIGSGNPQVYYNYIGARQRASAAALLVSLKHYNARTSPQVLENFRAAFRRIPGAQVELREFENGPGTNAPIEVRLAGEDLDEMGRMAVQVEALLRRHPGTDGVRNPLAARRTDFKVVVNQEAAALLGVARADIDRAVRLAFAGLNVARYRDAGGEEYNLQLALPRGDQATLENWRRIRVPAAGGAYVLIGQVARLEFISVPPVIERFNRERAGYIRSGVLPGYNTGKVTAEIATALGRLDWPAGLTWTFAGEVESQADSFGGLGTILMVAGFGILAILVLEFGSFRGTLIVASVVPLGLIGGVTALWLGGYSLSFTGAIGFVALVGMEIKNSILLVDFTNQLRAEGVPLHEAIERAGETRFLPIVLTTATALGALLPLALQGSGLYSPLALVIIGGLLSSLLLSRIVTPVVYSLLPPPIPEKAG